jgi:hypothetical protein
MRDWRGTRAAIGDPVFYVTADGPRLRRAGPVEQFTAWLAEACRAGGQPCHPERRAQCNSREPDTPTTSSSPHGLDRYPPGAAHESPGVQSIRPDPYLGRTGSRVLHRPQAVRDPVRARLGPQHAGERSRPPDSLHVRTRAHRRRARRRESGARQSCHWCGVLANSTCAGLNCSYGRRPAGNRMSARSAGALPGR